MHIKSVLASALVLTLTIISTTFKLLALASNEWSYQTYYFNDASAGLNPVNATEGARVCTGTRSPFYRCDVPFVYPNGTCFMPDCARYKPYGKDQTSCRSAPELGLNWTDFQLARGLMGYAQECQQGGRLFPFQMPSLTAQSTTREICRSQRPSSSPSRSASR